MAGALERGGNPGFTYKIVPGQGHGIRMSATVQDSGSTSMKFSEFVVDWVIVVLARVP